MAGVRLQTDDLERLNAAQRTLLSPLIYTDPAEWQLRCNRAIRRLVGADHSVFSLPAPTSPARPALITDDTDPLLPERFLTYFTGVVAGEYRFRDPVLQNAERRRRVAGGGAFHELDLGTRDAIQRSTGIQEIFRPAGLTSMIGLSTSAPEGEATQFFGFEGADADRRSERGLAVLRLVVPTFVAGVQLQRLPLQRGSAFVDAPERARQAAAVYSTAGTLLHHTGTLRAILAGEAESGKLRQVMDGLARGLGSRWSAQSDEVAAGPVVPTACVRCASAEYRLIASYLQPELIGAAGVLVTVERRRPLLPTPAELTARFALTAREAEVALLLTRGLTDAAVAARLTISPHTARRYSERVLTKLGIHSRAAVAITILLDERPDPA